MNDKAVCRGAPATPGLLNRVEEKESINRKPDTFDNFWHYFVCCICVIVHGPFIPKFLSIVAKVLGQYLAGAQYWSGGDYSTK